jgi:hypothetical protein
MPGPTLTEKVDNLAVLTAVLQDQVDTLKTRVDRAADAHAEIEKSHHDVDKRLSLATPELERKLSVTLNEQDKQLSHLARDMERLEKKVDELLQRRWEISKILITAFVSAIVSLTVTLFFDPIRQSLSRAGSDPAPRSGVSVRPEAPGKTR